MVTGAECTSPALTQAQLSAGDKTQLQKILEEATRWLQDEGPYAELEELEERLTDFQATVGPITSKLYASERGDADSEYSRSPEDL